MLNTAPSSFSTSNYASRLLWHLILEDKSWSSVARSESRDTIGNLRAINVADQHRNFEHESSKIHISASFLSISVFFFLFCSSEQCAPCAYIFCWVFKLIITINRNMFAIDSVWSVQENLLHIIYHCKNCFEIPDNMIKTNKTKKRSFELVTNSLRYEFLNIHNMNITGYLHIVFFLANNAQEIIFTIF